ncbi:MAG: MBG domain-containing protein, partial [Acidobacteriota bacterium]
GNGTNFVTADGVTATYSRAAGESVPGGPYHITATLSPASVLSNYSITNLGASFTINKAQLSLTADNKAMVLHASLPTFTASFAGFKFTDTSSTVSGTPSLTSTATSASPVGTYTIVAGPGSLASDNYYFVFHNGTLTIQYAQGGMCAGDVGHAIRQPINPDGSSTFRLGSVVPTKFAVCDANGNSIGTTGLVTGYGLVAMASSTTVTVDESAYSNTPDTAFRWDPTAMQWIFNQATKGNTSLNKSGVVYYFVINLNDGTSISFAYALK